jgi:peptidoglycan/LPS O-acetylase OafA/YrhL
VKPRGAIPSLDGIRAVAVMLVFLAHGGLGAVVPGGLGVTIFFVLSGYLITTLMREEHAASGTISFVKFYLRRLLRLMPPLLAVIAATAALSSAAIIGGHLSRGGLFAALFYYGNYFVIAHDFEGLPAGVGVIWSLAIEEHYYLVFPPLALLLLRTARRGLSLAVLGALSAALLAWRCWLVAHGASEAHMTMATDTRVDSILVGCMMALCWNPWLDHVPSPRAAVDLGVAAVCVATLAATLVYRDETFRLTARYTLQSLAIAPLLWLAVARARTRPFCWLNARPIAWLGTVSYTVYLVHHVIIEGMARHWPQLRAPLLMLTAGLATLLVAEAMRRWVEQPVAKLRRRLHGGRAVRKVTPAGMLGDAP